MIRERLRRILLGTIVLLYVVSIPWYRDGGDDSPIWLGMPRWVVVALGCYVLVAVLNAIAWRLTEVRDE